MPEWHQLETHEKMSIELLHILQLHLDSRANIEEVNHAKAYANFQKKMCFDLNFLLFRAFSVELSNEILPKLEKMIIVV